VVGHTTSEDPAASGQGHHPDAHLALRSRIRSVDDNASACGRIWPQRLRPPARLTADLLRGFSGPQGANMAAMNKSLAHMNLRRQSFAQSRDGWANGHRS